MRYPFEVPFSEVVDDPEPYIATIFACLESDFLVMPKGAGFVDYSVFEQGYEALKRSTTGFRQFDLKNLMPAIQEIPMVIIVLRTILGFTPPEWAYLATQRTGVEVTQGFVRSLDRNVRLKPFKKLSGNESSLKRIIALVATACLMLKEKVPETGSEKLHRLDKADTRDGISGMQTMATMGVPYAMLLYERFLGRPFEGQSANIRDSIRIYSLNCF